MMVHRVWQRFDIQPHRVEKFKISNDPQFEAKVRDIVGLYLDPPDRALVLCVDEKSQIQALDRTAPLLPLRPGLPERQTHDYKRHGTTTLFAAFNIVNGKVIASCLPRHRGKEFVKFLDQIEKEVPADLEVHLVMDNLLHSQGRCRPKLAPTSQAPTIPFSLYAYQQFMAQSGRTFLCPDHPTHDPARYVPQCSRAGALHLCLARQLEPPAAAFRLEGHR